jgi:hypothetical protein
MTESKVEQQIIDRTFLPIQAAFAHSFVLRIIGTAFCKNPSQSINERDDRTDDNEESRSSWS